MAKSKKIKFDDISILDYQKLAKEFKNETDRGAAILAANYVEIYLGKYLKSFMTDNAGIDELFNGFGPFATFSQRIKAAYALGYIDKNTKSNLELIREVRNSFAHNFKIKSFDNPRITSLCNKLTTAHLRGITTTNKQYIQFGHRDHYILAVAFFTGKMHNNMLGRQKNKKK